MLLPLADALRQVRADLASQLEPLRQLCRECGHRWRERRLCPVTTIHLFVLQVLHGNTACAHLPRLSGMEFSDSAYGQTRARLPLGRLAGAVATTRRDLPTPDRRRGLVARPPHLAGRRHRREQARHPRVAPGLRLADQSGPRVRLLRRPRPGPVPRRHGPDPATHHRAAVLAYPGEPVFGVHYTPSRTGTANMIRSVSTNLTPKGSTSLGAEAGDSVTGNTILHRTAYSIRVCVKSSLHSCPEAQKRIPRNFRPLAIVLRGRNHLLPVSRKQVTTRSLALNIGRIAEGSFAIVLRGKIRLKFLLFQVLGICSRRASVRQRTIKYQCARTQLCFGARFADATVLRDKRFQGVIVLRGKFSRTSG